MLAAAAAVVVGLLVVAEVFVVLAALVGPLVAVFEVVSQELLGVTFVVVVVGSSLVLELENLYPVRHQYQMEELVVHLVLTLAWHLHLLQLVSGRVLDLVVCLPRRYPRLLLLL